MQPSWLSTVTAVMGVGEGHHESWKSEGITALNRRQAVSPPDPEDDTNHHNGKSDRYTLAAPWTGRRAAGQTGRSISLARARTSLRTTEWLRFTSSWMTPRPNRPCFTISGDSR